ncbi:MAG: MraY family glycosyltransferase, partial [Candidatus Pacearchaeota archaeon]|nr:MraY family glycosyltransferase [Candidatus Pacearchaeota archaeon]
MNFFFPFILSFLVSAALIPVVRKAAERYKLFDEFQGDSLKIHTRKISFLGGAAIAAGALVALAFFAPQDTRLVAVFSSSLLVFGLGLYDDLKWKRTSSSRPLLKLFSLLLVPAAVALILSFGAVFALFLAPLVFLYIFAFMNALNYQDGMDGLAGTLSALSFAGFAVAGLVLSNPFAFVLSLALLGAVLGFLFFNFPPAKIFMGDSGAYFLGFCLAVLALLFSDFNAIQGVLGPVFL